MKIAVIGAGISGLSAAWLLAKMGGHPVTLFEKNGYLGGHTQTVDVTLDGVSHPVDTGFLVFNDRTYPNLIRLFEHLGIAWTNSEMSFSVKLTDAHGASTLEWAGTNLASVFAQPANLVKPSFIGMLRDLLRFNRQTTDLCDRDEIPAGTLGEFLDRYKYGAAFRDWYLRPMAGCIWSTPTLRIDSFPLRTFLTFCHNHGLLAVSNRPQWRTVVGGGRSYVTRIAADLADVRVGSSARRVSRNAKGVTIGTSDGQPQIFDQVVLACHSDQSLKLLSDADENERAVLSAIPYQGNHAVLHTDARFLPLRKRAWAAWNYHARETDESSNKPVSLSYLINRLQPVPFKTPLIVTLNPPFDPRPGTVLGEFDYEHPVFIEGSVTAQHNLVNIQGKRNTWFCGAWTRFGFHEDGLMSAIAVAKGLGVEAPWAC